MNTAPKLTLLFIALISAISLSAGTSDRAVEITYRFVNPHTVAATITTYTDITSLGAQRDSLPIAWGDGSTDWLSRDTVYSVGDNLQKALLLTKYQGLHTYAGVPPSGFTVMSLTDPNRNAGILNIMQSVNVSLYVEDTIWFAGQAGNNNGPVLLYPPVDLAVLNDTFFHNAAAYDVEADSLTFELVTPLQGPGLVVPGYLRPDSVAPGPAPGALISIDPRTGEVIWVNPPMAGIYDIAILIHEYRYGQLLSTMMRDMLIDVLEDTIIPRISGSFTDTTIMAGTPLSLPYGGVANAAYTDSLSAYSGIFLLPWSNAAFTCSPGPSATGSLTWTPGYNQYKPIETRIVAVRSLQQSSNPYSNIRAFLVTVVDPPSVSIPSGVESLAKPEIALYPIPAGNLLFSSAVLPASSTIADMMGREWPAKISGEQIDISSLAAGIYMLRWQEDGQTLLRRFIKE